MAKRSFTVTTGDALKLRDDNGVLMLEVKEFGKTPEGLKTVRLVLSGVN